MKTNRPARITFNYPHPNSQVQRHTFVSPHKHVYYPIRPLSPIEEDSYERSNATSFSFQLPSTSHHQMASSPHKNHFWGSFTSDLYPQNENQYNPLVPPKSFVNYEPHFQNVFIEDRVNLGLHEQPEREM